MSASGFGFGLQVVHLSKPLPRATLGSPQRVSVVFQDSRLLPWANLITNVTLGQRKAARARGCEALAEVGLEGRETGWPHQLSGGEQQRVALARSLVREPELLLADEPFGALDALTRLKMHGLLRNLLKVHRPAVLLVTHDVDEAITLADRVVVLSQGRIALERRVQLADDRDPSSSDFGHPPRAARRPGRTPSGFRSRDHRPHERQGNRMTQHHHGTWSSTRS